MLKNIKWYLLLRLAFQAAYLGATVTALLGRNFIVAIALMVLALLGGAWFCGWLCPFGSIQEWLGKTGSRIFGKKLKIPLKVEKYLVFSRYILFAAGIAGLGFLGFLSGPYRTALGALTGRIEGVTIAAWAFLGLMLLASLKIDRPFCRYFCTEGARYGILSLGRVFSIKRDENNCISCGKCNRVCPSQIKISTKKHVRNAQCINCLECIAACPVKETLKYSWAFTKKEKKNEERIDEETA